MIEVGRRIIFEKSTGKIIMVMGEMQGDVLPREDLGELGYIDLEYGQYSDEFSKVKSFHIDPDTKKVIFDEIIEPVLTPEQQIAELQQQLLQAQGMV